MKYESLNLPEPSGPGQAYIGIALAYTAFNKNAPYCHMWPLWIYHIIPHFLKNVTIFGKKTY